MNLISKYLLKKNSTILILIMIANICCNTQSQTKPEDLNVERNSLVDYVNPLIGTDSEFALSNGNTYPAIAVPWGMNFWTPQTAEMGNGWCYAYDAKKIRGIKQTHQPSPWINDYAAFSLMALTGNLIVDEAKRASWFSHKAEVAMPHYYSVYLADYDVKAEVTPTERAACFRFTFPDADSSYILLDAFNEGSMVEIIPEERKIIGYCRNNSGGVPSNFHNYFVAVFDKDFEIKSTWNDTIVTQNSTQAEGNHVGAVIGFKTNKGEKVNVKVASSFISTEQAQLNLNREIGSKSFETICENAKNNWNNELSKIMVEGGTDNQIETFYSCLYRVLLFPRRFYEIDANDKIVHYSPYNGKVLSGYMFTDNGFWDTFRAVFPFFNMMYPELNSQIMEGLANTYKESGWLPEWASPGHRDCMIGSNSAINIADAYLKGSLTDTAVISTLFEAMLKNATVEEGRPYNSVGRYGIDYYNKLGYVPYDVGIRENTARTLEYAFADFNIAQMAQKLGKPDIAKKFYKQSENYRNVFDKESKLMRGKNEDGTFQTPFNPLKWGDAFTEGNSLHYTWSVFHDIQGLINLMGGKDEFISMLDTVFNMPPDFDCSYYGQVIHEIREMQIVNMGNYAHGNQPIQHMIYLYNYAGQPWKTQQKVRNVMDKLYTPEPDGYCGDEDNGQTSAWYVFSAMGFYPVTPGTDEYIIGSPLFKKITLSLENGNSFVIEANNNSANNIYVNNIKLNNKDWNKNYIKYSDIQSGGKLSFEMIGKPNYKRGTTDDAYPYSMNNQ